MPSHAEAVRAAKDAARRQSQRRRVAWLVVDAWGPVGAFKRRTDALRRRTEAAHRWPDAAPCVVQRILYWPPKAQGPQRRKP